MRIVTAGLVWVLMSISVQAQLHGAPRSQGSRVDSANETSQAIGGSDQPSAKLAPSEELKAAMMPFDQARHQSDDLTEADKLALKVGRGRAAASCAGTTVESVTAAAGPAELLALARLCLFGQQFARAQTAATRYLQLDLTVGRRSAEELLTQAFLGLHDASNAAIQVRSLLSEVSYDGSLQTLLMEVVGTGALRQGDWMHLTQDLCSAEIRNGLKQLDTGSSFPESDGPSPSQLYRDTLFCVNVLTLLHSPPSPEVMEDVRHVLTLPAWQVSAEHKPMEEALERCDAEQKRSPVPQLRGVQIGRSGVAVPRSLSLQHGSVLLIPSMLWASDTVRIVSDLASAAPALPIYLVTSWAGNTGGSDQPNPQTTAQLRELAAQLSSKISILVVPDQVLQQFHLDVYPTAIAVVEGTVRAETPLTGETAERMALIPFGLVKAPASEPQPVADARKQ